VTISSGLLLPGVFFVRISDSAGWFHGWINRCKRSGRTSKQVKSSITI